MPAPRFALVLAMALAATLGACAEDAGPDRLEAALTFPGSAIEVADSGHWARVLGCSGFCVSEYHAWIDLAVRNDDFHKKVGIHYTTDGWSTVRIAHASYERSLGGGYEVWGIDLALGQGIGRPAQDVEYAAFVTMGGETHWARGNNHYIYDKVSAQRPVRLLSSQVRYEAAVGAVLTGTVRGFDLADDKAVDVRWTTDDWATWTDSRALQQAGGDWSFRIEGLGLDALPDRVRFAVRYHVGGAEHWDNNQGQDFSHVLAPSYVPGPLPMQPDGTVSGVVAWHAGFQTDLPIAGYRTRLDGGAWQDAATLVFSTAALADGPHVLETEVTLEGGYQTTREVTFTDRDDVFALPSWRPADPTDDLGPNPAAWDLDTDDLGRAYLQWDGHFIARYAAPGDALPELVFEPPPTSRRLGPSAVSPEGLVYASVPWNGQTLFRWTPDGALDADFGQEGVVDLAGTFDGDTICAIGDLLVDGDVLHVVDTCNHRLLRFTLDGAFVGSTPLDPVFQTGIPKALWRDADGLWVAGRDRLARLDPTQDYSVAHVLDVPGTPPLGTPRALVRAADGNFWAAGSGDVLTVFDTSGTILARWHGGGHPADTLDGAFHLPQAMIVVDDAIAVLGAEGATIAFFEAALIP